MKTILILVALFLSSCLHTKADDVKKITASTTSASFQCRSIGAVEACGARLYDCTDGLRRFDMICANNVTIDKW
jgi:hypothetical protein